jgi:hypothetical protein
LPNKSKLALTELVFCQAIAEVSIATAVITIGGGE